MKNREELHKSQNDQKFFIQWKKEDDVLNVGVYIDDLIFTRNDELMMKDFTESMQKEFDMTNLGKMRFFLGIEVIQYSNVIYMSKKKCSIF